MAKFCVFFVACLALASAGKVRREAPSMLQDLENHAVQIQKTLTEQFDKLSSSQNSKEFTKALTEGSDSIIQHLSTLSSSFQSALSDANGKAKEAVEKAHVNIQKNIEELRQAHPEVEQQAESLRNKLQEAFKKTFEESHKLAKEVAANIEQTNEKLVPQIKQAYDNFVKQAEEVQKKLHEAANKQ